jgi:hypothetical protein
VGSVAGSIELLVLAIQKGVERAVCLNNHAAPSAAVAAVRSAFWHKGFSAKAEAPTAPASRHHFYTGLIYELHDVSRDEIRIETDRAETGIVAPAVPFYLISRGPRGESHPQVYMMTRS